MRKIIARLCALVRKNLSSETPDARDFRRFRGMQQQVQDAVFEQLRVRVGLEKAGRDYKGCCPFHEEGTPSFWVSREGRFFHCFGCGENGTLEQLLKRLCYPE